MIDGQRIEVPERELHGLIQALEDQKRRSYFERAGKNERYYYLNDVSAPVVAFDAHVAEDDNCFASGNYCRNYDTILRRGYEEELNRLLWRAVALEHNGRLAHGDCNWFIAVDLNGDAPLAVIMPFSGAGIHGVALPMFDFPSAAKIAREIAQPYIDSHPGMFATSTVELPFTDSCNS